MSMMLMNRARSIPHGMVGKGHQVRFMATEKELKKRLSSVSNIRKITKATKMVAASKLRGVQNMLQIGRPFAAPSQEIWKTAKNKEEEAAFAALRLADPKTLISAKVSDKDMVVPMCSDRGLCGGVNSAIVRIVRRIVEDNAGTSPAILCMGERGRSALGRTQSHLFTMALIDVSKQVVPSFNQALSVSSIFLEHKFDVANVIWNRFKSAIAYETSLTPLPSVAKRLEGDLSPFALYEFEGDETETLTNLAEFTVATSFYQFMLENNTTEQSQKMSAMENSTKNAGELIDRLKIQYNRSRQARITTELTEIISGAAAIE